jgi:hypothetical protein
MGREKHVIPGNGLEVFFAIRPVKVADKSRDGCEKVLDGVER